jgi:lipooligosaccharide transport system permease protein
MTAIHRHPPGSVAASGSPGGALVVVEYLVRVWRRSILTTSAVAVGTPVIYLLALGFGLGTLVDAGPGAGQLHGVSYARFIAPALVTSAALATGISEAAYPLYSRFKWSRVFWGVAASPVSPGSIADGQALFIALRLTATSVLCFLVLELAGVGGGAVGMLLVPAAVLTGMSCAVWMMVLAAVMKREGAAINVVMRFGVIPMTLFSGSFFPIDRLPGPVRPLAWISPLWHGTELARSAALHSWQPGAAAAHLAFLAVLTAAGLLMARRKFRARLLT